MKTCIYQICYSKDTFENIPDGFLCLDHLKNERPDWRELWPIRDFLKTNELSDGVLYGFLSPKFSQKTLLNHQGVQDFLLANYAGEDLVSFSPFWDLMAIFKNVFEQGDFFHPGLANSDLYDELNAPTSYGEQQLPMKVFVQERLASICLLVHPNFRCLNYSPFNIGPSTTPFNQFFNEAVLSDALKRAYLQTKHISYLNAFATLRDSVIQQLGSIQSSSH